MTEAEGARQLTMFGPLVLALILWLGRPLHRRQFAACLISGLWAMPALLLLQVLNERAGWWTFAPGPVQFRGMPLELAVGWVVLWAVLPGLSFPRLAIGWWAAILSAVDLAAMPLCSAVVTLGPGWLGGEAVAVLLVLLPALALARWTRDDTYLHWRAALQVGTSALLFLFFIPELIFALRPGRGWSPVFELPGWTLQFAGQALFVIALPGLGAVIEFAARGGGTPIPYDAPKRLVTSGIYRYCANPMQLSCGAAMFGWSALLQNWWMALAAVGSVIYSAGIAEWDERQDLLARFGGDWAAYREHVQNWRVRWRPYAGKGAATLYISANCEPCRELRAWLGSRYPSGLALIDAEELPEGSITRMRYDPGDGTAAEEGVRALGRALEHLHFGWALVGIALRLPGFWQFAQLVADASGLEPRRVASRVSLRS